MPTVTDVLETVFKPPDIGSLVGAFQAAANAALSYNASQLAMIDTAKLSETQLLILAAALEAVTLRMLRLGALAAAAGIGVRQFALDQQDLFEAAVVLRNRGMEPMIQKLKDFASQLQETTAVDDEAVVGLGGLLAQFGIAADQIIPAVRAIVDANQAGKGSFDQLGEAFGKALLPGGRGAFALRKLGIEFKATGDRIADTNTLIKDFQRLAQGAAEARLDTPLGQFDQLKEALANLASAFGAVFGPALVTTMRVITKDIAALAKFLEHFSGFGALFGPPPKAGGIGTPGSAAIQADESLDYQKQTAANTKGLLDAIVKQVIGGSGTIAREAANTLAIRRALGG